MTASPGKHVDTTSLMSRIGSSVVHLLLRTLDPTERDVVEGDLRELRIGPGLSDLRLRPYRAVLRGSPTHSSGSSCSEERSAVRRPAFAIPQTR